MVKCFCKLVAPDASIVHASEWQVAGPNVVEPSSLAVAKSNVRARFMVFNANLDTPDSLNAANSSLVVNKKRANAAPSPILNALRLAIERGTALPQGGPTRVSDETRRETVKTAEFLAERLQDVFNFYEECFKWRGGKKSDQWPPNGFMHWGEEDASMFDEEADWERGAVVFGIPTRADAHNADTNMARILDIVGHECTHAVIHLTTDLEYSKQSGAVNESLADCFGIILKHWKLKQSSPEKANWVVGSGMNYPFANGIRSLRYPENYAQPCHMSQYDELNGHDNHGVHHNSGIPNHAFYLAAVAIGHPTWETLGRIWFAAMKDEKQVRKQASFADFAKVTIHHTPTSFKAQVTKAWEAVGVFPTA